MYSLHWALDDVLEPGRVVVGSLEALKSLFAVLKNSGKHFSYLEIRSIRGEIKEPFYFANPWDGNY